MYGSSACLRAAARIRGGPQAPQLTGWVRFFQAADSVLVVAELCGLPQNNPSGFFALHIHEGGSCCGSGFSQTGGHYNPQNALHPNHAGDLPAVLEYRGKAYLAVRTDRFCVRQIVGRTVVVHSGPDDYHSQPAGNAGSKIACGVIRRV